MCKLCFHQSRLTRSLYSSRCSAERLRGSHSSPHGGIAFIALHRHEGSKLESRTTARYSHIGTKPHGPFMVLGLANEADFHDGADFRTIRDPPVSGVLQKIETNAIRLRTYGYVTVTEKKNIRNNNSYKTPPLRLKNFFKKRSTKQ